ncbi:hypothetical protein MANES_14G089600v8 [Manihot esculenta]|uniref:Uncharacterized protein n=1 Tax=Manihot esculenta TaxID=3983 RepID=A0ACB7GFL1_MANES|nr:hypothetical protein MANES_14G089600v8 [Manihot esculenta]
MELPQQQRLFETEGRKPAHDFLSLCSHSIVQQDPKPHSQGYLKTQDFLRPLERIGKVTAKEETTVDISLLEKPLPPAPPPSVGHILPGGIGTFSISHVSNCFNQRISKPESSAIFTVARASSTEKNEEDSNCSSYTGSGFTPWEESALKKGKTRKEKEEERSNTVRGELRVKVDEKSTDHKTNTPRSKHSATEQRRRSKINDRFQKLRELIPHGDQKRDKASFLLEVIEYIQFLQEKVQKYEGSYQGWNDEPAKLVPWRNGNRPSESCVDQPRGMNSGAGPALLFAAKFDEKNINIVPTIPGNTRNPVESDMNSTSAFELLDQHPGITNKAMSFPMPLQPNFFNSSRTGGAVAQVPPRLISDAENRTSQSQPQNQTHHTRSFTNNGAVAIDKLKEKELSIEGGTINISSAYSQGLLNTLTQALQSCGVDLSQASISVQIELGKRPNKRPITPTSIFKDNEIPSNNQGTIWPRVSSGEESHQALKKLKTRKS